ncbi:helix-turn-helix domain-containing protein [Herbiconiux sp. VKM Ac-2851]|nr:helix-turn-helix domain-containing protein [Herbiconiux sp. VKM Ac-2851]
MDRAGMGDFMRRRRELLSPADLGLPGGHRRRAVGLRRDEVALQAGISTDYYARLEQARGANPSESVVASVARALRLDDDQRDHFFRLAGQLPPASGSVRHIRPGLQQLFDRLDDVPAMICTDLGDVLLQNTLATVLLGHFREPERTADPRAGNLVWEWFTNPSVRQRFPDEDWASHSLAHVRDLRATSSLRAGDPDVERFVAELEQVSDEFAELWQNHEVALRRFDHKRVQHPEVGVLDLSCEIVLTPDTGLQVIAFFPIVGTGAREQLDLLRVVGLQNLTAAPAPAHLRMHHKNTPEAGV